MRVRTPRTLASGRCRRAARRADDAGAGAGRRMMRRRERAARASAREPTAGRDAGRNVIRCCLPRPKGAGFRPAAVQVPLQPAGGERRDYIWNKWMTTGGNGSGQATVAVGADGAIYVADWFDADHSHNQVHDQRGMAGRCSRVPHTREGTAHTLPRAEASATEVETRAGPCASSAPRETCSSTASPHFLEAAGSMAGMAARAAGSLETLERGNPFRRARHDIAASETRPQQHAARSKSGCNRADPQGSGTVALHALRRGQVTDIIRRSATDCAVSTRGRLPFRVEPRCRNARPSVQRPPGRARKTVASMMSHDRWYLEAIRQPRRRWVISDSTPR